LIGLFETFFGHSCFCQTLAFAFALNANWVVKEDEFWTESQLFLRFFFPVRKKIASDRRFGLSGGHSLYSSTAMLYKKTNCQFQIKFTAKDYLQMYKTLQLLTNIFTFNTNKFKSVKAIKKQICADTKL
jgi:hypothetical protein